MGCLVALVRSLGCSAISRRVAPCGFLGLHPVQVGRFAAVGKTIRLFLRRTKRVARGLLKHLRLHITPQEQNSMPHKKTFKKGVLAFAVASAMSLTSVAFADVVIGVAGPMTGGNAAFGEQLWRGAEQAVKDINAAGGINGEQIKLVKGDDACEPKQAVAVANRLVDSDKAVAVIGHFCSSSTIPASEVYDEAGIISITPASTNPTVTERGLSGEFRICGR